MLGRPLANDRLSGLRIPEYASAAAEAFTRGISVSSQACDGLDRC